MSNNAAHNSLWRTADIYFGASLVTGIGLNYFQPLHFKFGQASDSLLLHLIGAPLMVLGGLIIIYAKQALADHNQPSGPGLPTSSIVQSGMYQYSRNPLYTGLALCYCGLAFAIDNAWLIFLLPPTLISVQYALIVPEERYLEQKFGDEFHDYKKRVRRWL